MQKPKLVFVQFRINKKTMVPSGIREKDPQNPRYSSQNGTLLMGPSSNVSLVQFCEDLSNNNYSLVDCFFKKRVNIYKEYYIVRFVFIPTENVRNHDVLMERQATMDNAFEEMKKSFWKVEVYENPYHNKGESVEDLSLGINCIERIPLFRPDGSLILRWQKDENGERVGDEPVPIKPSFGLCWSEGKLTLR